MSQGTLQVANQGFPNVRTDLNAALAALNSKNSGTAAPSLLAAGQYWLDVSVGTRAVNKQSDGSDWIAVTEFDSNANEARPYAGTGVIGRHPFLPASGTAPNIGASANPWGTAYVSAVVMGTGSPFTVYEEGSFTPTLAFGGSSGGITYNQQVGRYTRTGNSVKYRITVVLSSKGTHSGAPTVTLPFTSANVDNISMPAAMAHSLINLDTAGGYYTAYATVEQSASTVSLRVTGDNVSLTTLDGTAFQNTSRFFINGEYQV